MRFFKSEADADGDGFYDTLITAVSIEANQMTALKLNGRNIILTRWQEELVAFSRNCPHAGADLAEGEVYRYKVICPDHDYCFDIRTGRILWPEDENYRLKKYQVKEVSGVVKVKL